MTGAESTRCHKILRVYGAALIKQKDIRWAVLKLQSNQGGNTPTGHLLNPGKRPSHKDTFIDVSVIAINDSGPLESKRYFSDLWGLICTCHLPRREVVDA